MDAYKRWPVRQVEPVTRSDDSLVLVEYADFRGRWPNLFRVAPTGDEVWASMPPGGPDVYVQFELDGEAVVAQTHYGHVVRIDIGTGAIL